MNDIKFDILVQVNSYEYDTKEHSKEFYDKIISTTENFFRKEGFAPKGVNGYNIEGELDNVCYSELSADEDTIRKFLSENKWWTMGDDSECDKTHIALYYHEPHDFWAETEKIESDREIGTSDLVLSVMIWCDDNLALLNEIYDQYLN